MIPYIIIYFEKRSGKCFKAEVFAKGIRELKLDFKSKFPDCELYKIIPGKIKTPDDKIKLISKGLA